MSTILRNREAVTPLDPAHIALAQKDEGALKVADAAPEKGKSSLRRVTDVARYGAGCLVVLGLMPVMAAAEVTMSTFEGRKPERVKAMRDALDAVNALLGDIVGTVIGPQVYK